MTSDVNKSPTLSTSYDDFEYTEESNKRILIVDDETILRNLFFACLSERYSCATATNVEEALAYLAKEAFALVISDVMMPGRNGIELLREIIKQYPDTAIIIVSGVERTQRVLDAVRLGASDYLIKPCDLYALELSVERALERRSLLGNAKRYKQNLERRNTELSHRQSELQRLQAQIVQTEKMASLGQIAAGIAHELNNPAGFIYGNMEILKECVAGIEELMRVYDNATLPASLSDEIKIIKDKIDYTNSLGELSSIIADCHEGAERIRDVVQNLRLFSRLDEAEFKKIDLHEGIESTIRLLSRYYNPKCIVLHRDYAELPPVDCFAGQLNQVWMNLLVNAAQAVDGGGHVHITTRLKDQAVVVTIRDTGKGIAPEQLNKIFDPFFTTKSVGEGTGLGLSITYGIIERHHGSILVESRLGEGTTFTVTLPIEAELLDPDHVQ